jgi:hypothetical protein
VDALGERRAPDQVGGVLGLVAVVDLKADDLAAPEVEDQEQGRTNAPAPGWAERSDTVGEIKKAPMYPKICAL